MVGLFSPKIQRLVTPIRLQRRRHLNALKRRRLDSQKEQKAEYEYVSHACPPSPSLTYSTQCPHGEARCREKGQGRRHQGIAPQDYLGVSYLLGVMSHAVYVVTISNTFHYLSLQRVRVNSSSRRL